MKMVTFYFLGFLVHMESKFHLHLLLVLARSHIQHLPKLVSAFHVISEKKRVNPTLKLDYDIFVAGDSKESVEVVNGLINEIEGLRPIYLGPGALAYLVEMSTPLLLNAMIRNKLKNPGIKII